jgi:UDP:flavonoid glycosyltransferase YjiC (YdhE family)
LRLYFGEFMVPHLEALFTAVDAELADADLLVSHPAASLVGAVACERRGIPWIVGDLFPMLVPTATGPPSGMPDLGGTVNRAMWRLGRSRLVDPLTSRRAFVSFRRRLGLATDHRWNVVDARLSPYHNLALVSAHYVAPAADWPSNYRLVGFTSWSGPDAGGLPEDVEGFLDDGPPPVAVTLGTSGATARPDVFERVADALDETEPGVCSSPRTPPSPTAYARDPTDPRGRRSFPSPAAAADLRARTVRSPRNQRHRARGRRAVGRRAVPV